MTALTNHTFMTENFLLENRWSERLYHEFAARQPIVDFFCRIDARAVAEDLNYPNATVAWIANDPEKWRAMRMLGVPEDYISGDASDLEKFRHFAAIVPYLVGHPLYHQVHMDLHRYFGFEGCLDAANAEDVYLAILERLSRPSHSVQGMLIAKKTEFLVTALDPAESLAFYRTYSSRRDREITLIPGFYATCAYDTREPSRYRDYLEKLGNIAHIPIRNYDDLLEALRVRALDFHELGCRSADFEIGRLAVADPGSYPIDRIFMKVAKGNPLEPAEQEYFEFETLLHLSRMCSELGWVQGLHLGKLPPPNHGGPGNSANPAWTGSAPGPQIYPALLNLLGHLDRGDELTRTIIYPQLPGSGDDWTAMLGNFGDNGMRCKIQWGITGPPHFNREAITRQLQTISTYSNLSCSIGLPSHSRSTLTFSRFDYFRRILCNYIGAEIEKGTLPTDLSWLGAIVADVCYDNAKNFFHL